MLPRDFPKWQSVYKFFASGERTAIVTSAGRVAARGTIVGGTALSAMHIAVQPRSAAKVRIK